MAAVTWEQRTKEHAEYGNSYCVYQFVESYADKMCCLWIQRKGSGGVQIHERDTDGARERAFERAYRWLNSL